MATAKTAWDDADSVPELACSKKSSSWRFPKLPQMKFAKSGNEVVAFDAGLPSPDDPASGSFSNSFSEARCSSNSLCTSVLDPAGCKGDGKDSKVTPKRDADTRIAESDFEHASFRSVSSSDDADRFKPTINSPSKQCAEAANSSVRYEMAGPRSHGRESDSESLAPLGGQPDAAANQTFSLTHARPEGIAIHGEVRHSFRTISGKMVTRHVQRIPDLARDVACDHGVQAPSRARVDGDNCTDHSLSSEVVLGRDQPQECSKELSAGVISRATPVDSMRSGLPIRALPPRPPLKLARHSRPPSQGPDLVRDMPREQRFLASIACDYCTACLREKLARAWKDGLPDVNANEDSSALQTLRSMTLIIFDIIDKHPLCNHDIAGGFREKQASGTSCALSALSQFDGVWEAIEHEDLNLKPQYRCLCARAGFIVDGSLRASPLVKTRNHTFWRTRSLKLSPAGDKLIVLRESGLVVEYRKLVHKT